MDSETRSCYACDMTADGICRDHRLADAAPALLSALEATIEYLNGWPADNEQRRVREQARAAIAQAKGL